MDDDLHIEVAMQDPEIEVEAELLLGGQLWDALDMLQFKWQTLLFLQRMLFLLFAVERLILSPIDVHALEDVGSFLDTHFHVDALEGVL